MGHLASMTGYARAGGQAEGLSFTIEMKSVNGRGLDLRLRLPNGMDRLEPELRKLLGGPLTRGSVTVNINVQSAVTGGELVLNEQALDTVLGALQSIGKKIEADRPRLDGILALKGVLESRDTALTEIQEAAFDAAVLDAAGHCLADLVAARRSEGEVLAQIITDHLAEIERLTAAAEAHPARSREAILAKLADQVAALSESGANGLSEDRLNQEALLLATKADIREELDRLTAHVKAARDLMATGGAIGRKLDFLSQEFNREANTLCSKSNAVDLTAIGLDLKSVIDQLREQIQNLE